MLQKVTVMLLSFFLPGLSKADPCSDHKPFPYSFVGSRNERCPGQVSPQCDYYLEAAWYRLDEGTMLTHCPASGNCGVAYPAWMNGTLPTEADGIVDRTVCIKRGANCCSNTTTIRVRRCPGFYVYHIQPFDFCPVGYCFESNQSCVQPTTTPATDPCTVSKPFPTRSFGSRNEHCAAQTSPVCDYYLDPGWYSVSDAAMVTHCPIGDCGVGYPAWLNGSLPDLTSGVVERTVCVRHEYNCCAETVKAQIKHCGHFYAYHLQPFNGCPYGYCFESNLPCMTTTTQATNGEVDEQGSDSLLIGLTVTTGLVLVVMTTLLVVIVLQRWFKRNASNASVRHIDSHLTGKTVTSSIVKVPSAPPVYSVCDNPNVPAISPPPAYTMQIHK